MEHLKGPTGSRLTERDNALQRGPYTESRPDKVHSSPMRTDLIGGRCRDLGIGEERCARPDHYK